MRFETRRLAGLAGAFLFAFAAGAGFAQQTTTTETKNFEVLSVDGNKVVARDASGAAKEYTLPDDFQFNTGGKQLSVRELKPGMKGTATITTTTTTVPVHVTEVRNGEVVKAEAGTIILKGEKGGYQLFSQGDVNKRKIQIVRDGKPVKLSDLRVGDRLTATLVTEGTPKVLTERQVQASIAQGSTASAPPAKPTAKPAAQPAATASTEESYTAAPSTAAAGTGEETAHSLPPTASSLPLLGLIGMALFAVGLVLRSRRLRG